MKNTKTPVDMERLIKAAKNANATDYQVARPGRPSPIDQYGDVIRTFLATSAKQGAKVGATSVQRFLEKEGVKFSALSIGHWMERHGLKIKKPRTPAASK